MVILQLSLQVRVEQGVMAMKGYSTFPKNSNWNLNIRCSFASYPGPTMGTGSYSSKGMLSAYSTALADWAISKKQKLQVYKWMQFDAD